MFHEATVQNITFYLRVSRPDFRDPFFSMFVRSGCDSDGKSMLSISLFWPGMILNQGQLSIVVSDWESYLGSPFPLFHLWDLIFASSVSLQPSESCDCSTNRASNVSLQPGEVCACSTNQASCVSPQPG
jgi:hypothetical protein